ncbi:hypothetical protein FHR83_006144 [Actinoplanes campanulatus]|uniref:Tetratricopeptide repeat-containing protein n=1 Tax=Actinoplanes campanulatus TaxID=113559 RepID=A0A7W5ALP8_9ACTN|nr:hypothetical protein [Actinoplanes campanulatus]MBB3098445.1 hypothetical protein [Actinoplanes campanulatus]GGN35258.1 hypothetical protein GCM10010109_59130 [Actinoplanes campanulatus]GID39137.1 hypothetical protein Aca09nite_56430 [Actinoplanes campanulatus]
MPGDDDPLNDAERIFQAYVASGGADARQLPKAAHHYRHALATLPTEHPQRLPVTANLMACLRALFLTSADRTHLDDAITLGRQQLDQAGPAAQLPLAFHTSLAGVHNARFQYTEDPADLDATLDHLRAAADLAHATEPGMLPALRNNLAFTLRLRYDITRDRDNLDEAIALARSAHQDAPEAVRPKTAYMLSSILMLRHRDLSARTDLDEALHLATDVVDQTRPDHPEYSGYLAHLAAVEVEHHQRTRDPQTRERAAAHYERLLDLLDTAPAIRPVVIANWAQILETARGKQPDALALITRMLPELEAAAEQARGSAHRPGALTALARAHLAVHEIQGTAENLRTAITSAEEAVATTPPEHPDHAEHSLSAAAARLARWPTHHDHTDLDRAGTLLADAANHPIAAPAVRIQAAHALIAARTTAGDTAGADHAARHAVDLLPVVAWPGVPRSDQEFRLAQVADVSSDATAAVLAAGHHSGEAVEVNEAGRAVLWAHLLNQRTDLAAIDTVAPHLATAMARVRRDLA